MKKIVCFTFIFACLFCIPGPAGGSMLNSQANKNIPVTDITVGAIYESDSYEYSALCEQGIAEIENQLGLTIIRENAYADELEQIFISIERCIMSGASIVFNFLRYSNFTEILAEQYPDVLFVHPFPGNGEPNIISFVMEDYWGAYLAGVSAALRTESGKIGFVGKGLALEANPMEMLNVNAFALGAESINPEIEVHLNYTYSWNDINNEIQAAHRLADEGVDVIFDNTPNFSAVHVAEERGIWCVGNAVDLYENGANSAIGTIVQNYGSLLSNIVIDAINGETANVYRGNTKNESIYYIESEATFVTDEMRQACEDARVAIIDGLEVFYGQMETNDGSMIGEVGESMFEYETLDFWRWAEFYTKRVLRYW